MKVLSCYFFQNNFFHTLTKEVTVLHIRLFFFPAPYPIIYFDKMEKEK